MKKIVLIVLGILFFYSLQGQSIFRRGVKIGNDSPTSNILAIDSAIYNDNGEIVFYSGGVVYNAANYDTLSLEDVALLKHPDINAQTGTTYTLALTDDGKVVTCNNSSAITVTVPPNSSVAFPIGTQVSIIAIGAGQVTIAAGSGVTINSAGGALKLRVQYSTGTLLKIGTNTWILFGDITAS